MIRFFPANLNIFRFLGDLSHLASFFVLLHQIEHSKSVKGISLKSQALYLTVFLTRYIDLFTGQVFSIYNTVLKIVFIAAAGYIVYLILVKYSNTRFSAVDSFRVEYLVGGAALLALIFHYKFSFTELLWTFSIYLESVAIMPQLFMLQRVGSTETLTTHYLFALGAYRALYIPNWIYRYFTENTIDPISVGAGIIQTIIFSDFFYIYFTKVLRGKKFELPA